MLTHPSKTPSTILYKNHTESFLKHQEQMMDTELPSESPLLFGEKQYSRNEDELATTKEEIKKARESLMQEWLDSKPLIDQLEKLQSDLKCAQARSTMCTVLIPGLEAQLETAYNHIRSAKTEELEANTSINKLTQSSEQIREEMERIKLETDTERRARGKMKQELRVMKQTLQTLQLTLRAVRIESEALSASNADSVYHVHDSNVDDGEVVKLSYEEYYALAKKAHEGIELADWRVSVSIEQKKSAEDSRNKALRRYNKAVYSMQETEIIEVADINGNEMQEENSSPPEYRRQKSNSKKKTFGKKKPSILHQIKNFFVLNILKIFR